MKFSQSYLSHITYLSISICVLKKIILLNLKRSNNIEENGSGCSLNAGN